MVVSPVLCSGTWEARDFLSWRGRGDWAVTNHMCVVLCGRGQPVRVRVCLRVTVPGAVAAPCNTGAPLGAPAALGVGWASDRPGWEGALAEQCGPGDSRPQLPPPRPAFLSNGPASSAILGTVTFH